MTHISKVNYTNQFNCESDIENSERLVIKRVKNDFDNRPEEIVVKASCFKRNEIAKINKKPGYEKKVELITHYSLCKKAIDEFTRTWSTNPNDQIYIKKANKLGIKCEAEKLEDIAYNNKELKEQTELKRFDLEDENNDEVYELIEELEIKEKNLEAEKQKRIKLETQLAQIKEKQKQEKKKIESDTIAPSIEISNNVTNDKKGTIEGIVADNIKVAEFIIEGKQWVFSKNGTFKYSTYVPPKGKEIVLEVTDLAGLTSRKTIFLTADRKVVKNSLVLNILNPLTRTVKINKDALALIIGVANYENTKTAAFADNDALVFKDYAVEKLGILPSNIKELLNDKAERIDITRAIKSWLLKRTVTEKTDIYVFFAGHGLATDDSKGMYLLPYDGDPEYLEDSAIKRKNLFDNIQATKPRSVTIFLDTCYSGGTRNDETLVANLRPIIIPAKEQSIPNNFTVFSAAQGNQTSQSLEEVKHGLFSYYMMLGMEGGADLNADKKITARELHSFVVDKVERQSQFRQTPELQGDKDRVLVQFQ